MYDSVQVVYYLFVLRNEHYTVALSTAKVSKIFVNIVRRVHRNAVFVYKFVLIRFIS